MLLLILLVLPAIIYGQQPYQDGQRRSRQLDLGLQDISKDEKISKNEPIDLLNNGYLPPVSATLPPKVVAAQSQQTFEAVQNTLCNPPFDSIFCPKSKLKEEYPKPSRHLVPPFNDIEEAPTKSTKAKIITTTTTVASTTRKPVQTTTQSVIITKVKEVVNKAESTNELRSYLPPQPEYSGAAQTSVGVVRPPDQSHDHHDHDHHHHHHHTGNICDDAFHSFLCAPLKARKRITGALPNSLRGSSSFVQYQKVRPSPDKEPAPSNTFQNEYLPPRTTPAPTPSPSTVRTTYAPPRTTQRRIVTTTTPRPYSPLVVPQPSNENDRFYLPPVTSNKIFVPVQPQPSNQLFEKLQPSSTTRAPTTYTTPKPVTRTVTTPKPTTTTFKPIVVNSIIPEASFQFSSIKTDNNLFLPFAPLPSDEDRSYLPPKPSPQPAASFVSTTKFYPSTTKFSSLPPSSPTVSTFVPLPSNTIVLSPQPKIQPLPVIPPQPKVQPLPVIPLKPKIEPLPVIPPQPKIQPLPVIPIQPKVQPQPVISLQPQIQPLPVIPIIPKIQPLPVILSTTVTPVVLSTTVKPITLAPIYVPPITTKAPIRPAPTFIPKPTPPKYQAASNLISTTIKPFTTTQRPTTKFVPAPSSPNLAYLPSDPNYQPAAAQIDAAAVAAPRVTNPFHHGRDLCTDPFHSFLCAAAKPRKRITGALPAGYRPDSSNVNVQVKPAPSFQNENRIKPEKPLETSQSQNIGYSYPKPINQFPSQSNSIPASTPAPTTGYSYPKPEKIFPLPSQQQEVVKITTTTTKRPAPPPVLRTSEARVVSGYTYPKPINPFPSQSNSISTSTAAPTTGYSYPKPEKIFPLPSQTQEIVRITTTTKKPAPPPVLRTSEARVVSGYSYPKPEISFPPSTAQSTTPKPLTTGYDYPKPQKPFPLPTEQKEVVASSPKPSSVVPQSTNQAKGYQYPKPEQSFPLPDNKGYFYPKPEKKLDLPTETKPKSLFPQTNSNPNIFGNSESAEFIPVNKLDKRDDSKILSGLKRFGERLRRLERRH